MCGNQTFNTNWYKCCVEEGNVVKPRGYFVNGNFIENECVTMDNYEVAEFNETLNTYDYKITYSIEMNETLVDGAIEKLNSAVSSDTLTCGDPNGEMLDNSKYSLGHGQSYDSSTHQCCSMIVGDLAWNHWLGNGTLNENEVDGLIVTVWEIREVNTTCPRSVCNLKSSDVGQDLSESSPYGCSGTENFYCDQNAWNDERYNYTKSGLQYPHRYYEKPLLYWKLQENGQLITSDLINQNRFGWYGDAMQDAVFFDRSEQKCSYHGGLNNDANLPENMPGGRKTGWTNNEGWWQNREHYFWPLRPYKFPFRLMDKSCPSPATAEEWNFRPLESSFTTGSIDTQDGWNFNPAEPDTWSAPGFECAPRNMRCIFNFTNYNYDDNNGNPYGGTGKYGPEIGSSIYAHMYWSFNAANQQCCWNRWLEASQYIFAYYYDHTWLESAYDADNDPSTVCLIFKSNID